MPRPSKPSPEPDAKPNRPNTNASDAPFALTSNGLLLVNINQCRGRDLEGREQFVGVSLRPNESQITRGVLENACFDAAGQVAGSMPPSPRATSRSHPKR